MLFAQCLPNDIQSHEWRRKQARVELLTDGSRYELSRVVNRNINSERKRSLEFRGSPAIMRETEAGPRMEELTVNIW